MRRQLLSASLLAAVLPGTCAPEVDLMGRMVTLAGVEAAVPIVGYIPSVTELNDLPDPPAGGGGGAT